ncbi:hypothetical protein IEE84_04330 [Psychrobacter sp. 28M-43]|uniref:hypothetical protein n=1 Tax=Psychrobacter sp. 28M-43 TaxID=2772254 RepID=UPI00168D57FB|nr:hypothetical protein [Psychrobacter sp. 28M-43]QOD13513.1 hypothetical protein IEE84_04330 [Psychrobacter sp. 28M-43]
MSNKDCSAEYVETIQSIRSDVRDLRFMLADKSHGYELADGLLDKLGALELLTLQLLKESKLEESIIP